VPAPLTETERNPGTPPAFERTLERVDALLTMHRSAHGGAGRPYRHWGDVLRGAVVLSLAALDACVMELIVQAVPPLAKTGQLGTVVQSWIKDNAKTVMACFAEPDPTMALGDLARGQLSNLTFQRAHVIEAQLRTTLHCPAPWAEARRLLNQPRRYPTNDAVKDALDEYVQRRHRIAHDGDVDHGRTRPITRPWVEAGVVLVRCVGWATAHEVHQHGT
jgi:hypothetical protein